MSLIVNDILNFYPCPHDCGICCSIPPQLDREDIKRITKSIKHKPKIMHVKHKNIPHVSVPYLKPRRGHCQFYDSIKKKCKIYLARPRSCREYPFTCDIGGVIWFHVGDCTISQEIYKDMQKMGFVGVKSKSFDHLLDTIKKKLSEDVILKDLNPRASTAIISDIYLEMFLTYLVMNK